jgi:hypothetical protein
VADSKLTALSALSVPALEDLAYIVDDPSGTPTSYKSTHARLGGLYVPGICDGRLTLDSGNPVTATDITGATTIYWAGYKGNRVGLYDGTRWDLYEIGSAKSFALGTLTSGALYDLFVYNNAGTLTLERSNAWSDQHTRADTLTLQNNVLVKSGATTRRYLGTFYTTSTTTTEDSGGGTTTQVGGKRYLYNYYNRVARSMAVFDSTASWTYTTNSWRQANAASGNKVGFVLGILEDGVTAVLQAGFQGSGGAYAAVGIGVDATSTIHGAGGIALGTLYNTFAAQWNGFPSASGLTELFWNENGLGSAAGLTFVGAASGVQTSRLMATVFA